MSDPVQELVDAITGMRQDLTRVFQQIEAKAATPQQLAALQQAVAKADPAKIEDAAKRGTADAAAKLTTTTTKMETLGRDIAQQVTAALQAVSTAEGSIRGWSRKALAGAVASILLLGVVLGVVGGAALGLHITPATWMATKTACTIGGGAFIPAQRTPQGVSQAGCWYGER